MQRALKTYTTHSPEGTSAFAEALGAGLAAGDTVLLEGDIGAGKTHFARSLIQSLQDPVEDVPSPTFTLVQTYESAVAPIWHADLYRLSDPGEIAEIGLLDAIDTEICLIEWPDRLGSDWPSRALLLRFETPSAQTGQDAFEMRSISAFATDEAYWRARLPDMDVSA